MRKSIDFVREIYRGKSIGRILFNWKVYEHTASLTGDVVDFAGGGNPSYCRYVSKGLHIIRTNYQSSSDVDLVVDLNKPLSFGTNSITSIFFFNALYIINDRSALFKEFHRILKSGGVLYMSSPFISNEMPEPHDYCRLTAEGLTLELQKAGFTDISIDRYGDRFTSATCLLHQFYFFDTIRLCVYGAGLFLDMCIPKKIRSKYPAPLGYFCVIRK